MSWPQDRWKRQTSCAYEPNQDVFVEIDRLRRRVWYTKYGTAIYVDDLPSYKIAERIEWLEKSKWIFAQDWIGLFEEELDKRGYPLTARQRYFERQGGQTR